MRTKIKISYVPLLCLMAFTCSAIADEGTYWMNSWDEDCYEYGVNTCRDGWYKTPQGSHLIMWEVFKTIEEADSQALFSERHSLSQYGFLFPELNAYTPEEGAYNGSYEERVERDLSQEGLPLGFVKDKSQLDNRNYLGLTCAGCHTANITYGTNNYFVEGGQANADVALFLNELADALEANRNDYWKMRRFRDRFKSYVRSNRDYSAKIISTFIITPYLDEAIDYVRGFTNRNHQQVVNGPARLDAIGSILNQLHVSHADESESLAKPLTAPVSYPYIWNVADLECVQTNCISNDPLARNVGEVLGVFGYVNVDENKYIDDTVEVISQQLGLNSLFNTTAKVDNMYALERTLDKMNPPKWPSSFPALDPQLVTAGKAVYTENCTGCHVNTSDGIDASELTAPNSIGKQFIKVARQHYTEVGTDPAFAEDYGTRKEKSGIMGAVISLVAPDSVDPETGIPFGETFPDTFNALVLLGAATDVIINDHSKTLGFKLKAKEVFPALSTADAVEALMVEYTAGQVDRNTLTPTSYKAKPLDGIAFTGPFLHNGSVRTLEDLLNKPEDRATTFNTGTTEYDVDGAGYVSGGDFLLDTTIRGNGKEGHLYGTTLSSADKAALLEYLKSI